MNRKVWGDLFVVVLALAYPFHVEVGGLNLSVGDPWIAGGLIVLLLARMRRGLEIPPVLTLPLVLAVLAGAGLALHLLLGTGVSVSDGLVEIVKWLAGIAWALVAFHAFRDDSGRRVTQFLVVSSFVALLAVAVGAVHVTTGTFSRARFPFDGPNIFGNYMVFAVAMLVALALRLRGTGRAAAWAGVPIMLLGLVLSGSRGAILGLVAATLVTLAVAGLPRLLAGGGVPAFRLRRSMLPLVLILAVSGLTAAGAGVSALLAIEDSWIVERFTRTVQGDGPNVSIRQSLWGRAWELSERQPLLGIGYGQFPGQAEAVGLPRYVPHNTPLTMFTELGAPGLLVYALFVVWLVVTAGQAARRAAWVWPIFAFVLATMAQSIVANTENYRALWLAIALIATVTAVRRMPAQGDGSTSRTGSNLVDTSAVE